VPEKPAKTPIRTGKIRKPGKVDKKPVVVETKPDPIPPKPEVKPTDTNLIDPTPKKPDVKKPIDPTDLADPFKRKR
jgi:hypothetical protein